MAFPTVDKPYGLLPVNLKGGIPFAGSTRMIPIGQGYATSIFDGDVVGLSNGNAIITPYNADTQSAAAAGDIVGVFLGCEYSNTAGPIFGKVRQQYYPASTNAPDAVAYVLDDPNALFKSAVVTQPQGGANTQLNTGTTIGYMRSSSQVTAVPRQRATRWLRSLVRTPRWPPPLRATSARRSALVRAPRPACA